MIFRAARKIVLEERRAQSHLEAHCHLDIEQPQHLSVPVINRQLNSDVQSTHTTSPVKQHRSSSASTTVKINFNTFSYTYHKDKNRKTNTRFPLSSEDRG